MYRQEVTRETCVPELTPLISGNTDTRTVQGDEFSAVPGATKVSGILDHSYDS
jgi:hypothetical protein